MNYVRLPAVFGYLSVNAQVNFIDWQASTRMVPTCRHELIGSLILAMVKVRVRSEVPSVGGGLRADFTGKQQLLPSGMELLV